MLRVCRRTDTLLTHRVHLTSLYGDLILHEGKFVCCMVEKTHGRKAYSRRAYDGKTEIRDEKMTARIFQLSKQNIDRSPADIAVNALRNGELVVLPTETVYGIAVRADDQAAVEHLLAAKNRSEKNPFTLAFSGIPQLLKFVPQMSVTAERLARRCFPGPVTLVMNADLPESAVFALPEGVRRYIMPEDSIGIRVPQNTFTLEVLRKADFPIALTSANLSGQVDSTSAEEVIQALGDKVDLIFDDGDSPLKRASSVLQFAKNSNIFRILRAGAVSKGQLERLAQPLILFVCSGNTCRSPMAEVLARAILAQMHGTVPEKVEQELGIQFLSAGTYANDFSPASPNARHAMNAVGLSLAQHISRPVTPALLEYADLIYAMTPAHCRQMTSIMPEISHKIFTLARTSGGISDPYGGSIEVYETCARQIREALEKEFAASDFQKIAFSDRI